MNKADLIFTTSGAIHSKLIKWFTCSIWSHVMIATGNGEEVISADGDGIMCRDIHADEKENFAILHYPAIVTKQTDAIVRAAFSLIGKPYDYIGTFIGIPTGNPNSENPDKWFCSESAFWCYQKAGIELLKRIEGGFVTPEHMWISPLLERRW